MECSYPAPPPPTPVGGGMCVGGLWIWRSFAGVELQEHKGHLRNQPNPAGSISPRGGFCFFFFFFFFSKMPPNPEWSWGPRG